MFWLCAGVYLCFFFFKQKTAYEMRISDWSSDVCSSDLTFARAAHSAGTGITVSALTKVSPLSLSGSSHSGRSAVSVSWARHRAAAADACRGGEAAPDRRLRNAPRNKESRDWRAARRRGNQARPDDRTAI